MDLQAARSQALGAAGSPRGSPLQRVREAPPALRLVLPQWTTLVRKETAPAVNRLDSGEQSIPNDISTHGEGTHSEEEGFAAEEEESDGEPNPWELSEGTHCPPKEQTANLFNVDWDLELKADQGNLYDAYYIQSSISQEIKT
ncbi:Coordinator of PRMT5 and differentiation stimulator [Sciurus carolinensis]|uniref:Coordinator of PRMT5 and differentiation stimulator n=1 Tax=Sciurus carolinensis TaxID=30640 RepID=A0AA41MZC5_SCICA|nr:Coordinator of PRMT5 and differentiation stimulator [Sciurus carolinensis]